jgi:hypothetical protein
MPQLLLLLEKGVIMILFISIMVVIALGQEIIIYNLYSHLNVIK